MVQRNEECVMIEDRLQKGTYQKHAGPLTGLAVHYKRNGIQVWQEQVSSASLKTFFV